MSAHQKLTPQSAQDVTATHTPGPWSMSSPPYDSIPWHHVYGPDGRHIMHRERPSGEKIANTFLIAAAPDLLAALEDILDSTARTETMGEVCQKSDFDQARAAIAKVTAA